MEQVRIMTSPDFGEIKMIERRGEPYFCVIDILHAIGKNDMSYVLPKIGRYNIARANVQCDDKVKSYIFANEIGIRILLKVVSYYENNRIRNFKAWFIDELPYVYAQESEWDDIVAQTTVPILQNMSECVDKDELFLDTYLSYCDDDVREQVKQNLSAIHCLNKDAVTNKQEHNCSASCDVLVMNALLRRYANQSACNNDCTRALGEFKRELKYNRGIDLNRRKAETNEKIDKSALDFLFEKEYPSAIATLAAMCHRNNVNINDILSRRDQTNLIAV